MKTKTLVGSLLVLVLIVVGYFLIPKLFKSSEPVENSIAVLPFRNDSPSDTSAFIINGIMEEILNDLAKIEDIKVLSRSSVEPYRSTTKSIAEIAKELGVIYILEGSGQKYGNNIRLNVQLVDAKINNPLWSESYELGIGNANDIYSTQTEISQTIANKIETQIPQ